MALLALLWLVLGFTYEANKVEKKQNVLNKNIIKKQNQLDETGAAAHLQVRTLTLLYNTTQPSNPVLS